MKTKTAMITIAGRPNVGKSTLANALVGEKIAIVSHKPQTTRNRICAIVDRGDTQLVFIDTPGFHRPRTKLGDYMVNVVNQSVVDVDAGILLVEPIANVGPQEQELIEKIREAKVPAILCINKIDTVEKENLLPVIAAYKDLMDFVDVIPISAKWHDGLDSLMQVCEGFAQPGPFMFPEGISTDMPEKQVMAEIIRVHYPDIEDVLLQETLRAFYWLRDLSGIQKKPSTSEVLDWIQALQLSGINPQRIAGEIPYAGVLLKKNEDLDVLHRAQRG